ncbi:MAG: ATP-binding cassette domain-containing protein [Clostridia bacterium]|nr:ATP-binding cassette domain-containing protein [Clostridia bacterium]
MIEFKNVTKVYPNGTIALDGIDLTIEDGEFVFIVGGNGSGKTTLTRLLIKEEEITSGEIIVNEQKLSKLKHWQVPYYRRGLGMVFQDFKLLEQKTVSENVAFAMDVIGKPKKSKDLNVKTALELVRLLDKAHCKTHEISGGERQKLAIARAFVNEPKVIIADEPTGNIDPEMSRGIMELLIKINKQFDRTVIVITHEEQLVNFYKKRVIRINNGKIESDEGGGKSL